NSYIGLTCTRPGGGFGIYAGAVVVAWTRPKISHWDLSATGGTWMRAFESSDTMVPPVALFNTRPMITLRVDTDSPPRVSSARSRTVQRPWNPLSFAGWKRSCAGYSSPPTRPVSHVARFPYTVWAPGGNTKLSITCENPLLRKV